MASFGGLVGGWCGLLGSPVVNVPVVLIEEEVILLEELGRHGAQLGIGEGAEEKIALECTSLTTLVWQLSASGMGNMISIGLESMARKGNAGAVERT